MRPKRLIIIGGVAAGASCATRTRRLDEQREILVFERGPYVSFASCGLPYHLSGVIAEEDDLLLVGPEDFKDRYNVDVHTGHEVLEIDREGKRVRVRDLSTDACRWEGYDDLVITTGAKAFMPPIPGLDSPGVFQLRTVPQARAIRNWIDKQQARTAVVIGAGFIGLEAAENLVKRGLSVQVVEAQDQVLPPLDSSIAERVGQHLEEKGVGLHLGVSVEAIESEEGGALTVCLQDGSRLVADLVLAAIGVRPRSELAGEAGLELAPGGAVVVDDQMRTNDPHIFAAGDVVQTACAITGRPTYLPLAGPANRQGRLVGDALLGRGHRFRGVQGTVICGLFDLTVAATGLSRRTLAAQSEIPWSTLWIHPKDHVGYYPGAHPITLQVTYDTRDGRVLGAQAVGEAGVARRIDVLAMAIQLGGTLSDLEQAELCYAPQFGAAKDAVNMVGMVGANQFRGELPSRPWSEAIGDEGPMIDVREPAEFEAGHVQGALNLPLSQLRGRLNELPTARPLLVYCQSGKRSYDAVRFLNQVGIEAQSVLGGLMSRPRGEFWGRSSDTEF